MAAYDIITVAQAKSQLGITNTDLDTVLGNWISWASDGIEKYLDNKVAVQSISNEIHDGDGTRILYPRYFPIVQLSTETSPTTAQKLAALQRRNDVDSSWQDIETNINHVFVDSALPYIELNDEIFWFGKRNIQISYKAGYSTIPGDIVKVCLEMVQMQYNEAKMGKDWLGKTSVNNNEQSGTNRNNSFSQKMEERWAKVLDRYRRPRI